MTGSGWLSPSMDIGTTVPNLVGSQWGILTDIAYTTPGLQNQTFSEISHPNGLQIAITTTLTDALLNINFVIRNTSTTNTVSNLVLSDYFNFHPNGSLHSNQSTRQGTTRYLANCPAHIGTCNGVIYTTGNQSLSTFVSQGFVYGQRAPDAYATGYASGMPIGQQALFTQMANGIFNNQAGPVGPADSAGALAYNLGNLAPLQQTAFTFYKGLDVPTPEPAAWAMMSLGLILLVLRARRQRKQNLELARLRSRMDCVKQV
ncbi:MAG: PEP-CTERM sorting domain-containing protein [Acidobacteria bacterium]|nr:PEP-CTERM sorting domain-containing protein [Acidobacteriota bacterium]